MGIAWIRTAAKDGRQKDRAFNARSFCLGTSSFDLTAATLGQAASSEVNIYSNGKDSCRMGGSNTDPFAIA
ncbi:hypothetical protein CUZ56_01201 [Saezia sanguinis]|uniref:Uncharacterized protein n=1 Tax=Saezia sanguinis TaxID=1965230 RepID=A0A433SEU3_9BURK|nr:hypothetical protein CUZ56_01201 [Saezia sanguinis]